MRHTGDVLQLTVQMPELGGGSHLGVQLSVKRLHSLLETLRLRWVCVCVLGVREVVTRRCRER